MIIVYILMFLCAFFKAGMDCFENENFFESIFKNWDQRFWYKRESWKHCKKILGYRFDSWHICNSLMWACVIAMAVVAWYLSAPDCSWIIHFCGLGLTWNVGFSLFYNIIFKVK